MKRKQIREVARLAVQRLLIIAQDEKTSSAVRVAAAAEILRYARKEAK